MQPLFLRYAKINTQIKIAGRAYTSGILFCKKKKPAEAIPKYTPPPLTVENPGKSAKLCNPSPPLVQIFCHVRMRWL
jgi:hypothetical protein